MAGQSPKSMGMSARRALLRAAFVCAAAFGLAACGGGQFTDLGIGTSAPLDVPPPEAAPVTPVQPGAPIAPIGQGATRVALVLPLSSPGNAGAAATSMKNAAEMAIAEFRNPNIQLLVKDDGGTPAGAQLAAQQALSEGAAIVVGPLFAQSVSAAAAVTRPRNVPMIAFSTDANVATRGVYLLSFLPESDVHRIVDYAVSRGKRSFAAMVPDNAYGSVVEAAFQQAVARRGGRVVALERYSAGAMAQAAQRLAQSASRADAIFIPDNADNVPQAAQALQSAGVNLRRVQLLGTGLWDEPRVFAAATLRDGWYPSPDTSGYQSFAQRYRARYGAEPVRTAPLTYDAVALIARLVQTEGPNAFTEQTLTNPSGFAGVDGVFRFRADGTNERGLAVMKVTPQGGEVVSPAPRSFGPAS
jgi:branched-chain amino acid transport system substrate-binding protein